MSSRGEQALLIRNLSTLRYWVDKTESGPWVQNVARDLGDRCQYNIGWHAAKHGDDLGQLHSTASLNHQLAELIKLVESYGKVKRGPGQPKNAAGLNKAQVAILDKHLNDPKARGLEHFVSKAMHEGAIASSKKVGAKRQDIEVPSATRELERARDRAIEAGKLDPKYNRSWIDPSKLSMEDYADWHKAGYPVFRTKSKKARRSKK
jgi:hypothetical protein